MQDLRTPAVGRVIRLKQAAIGQRATVDIARDYLDDSGLELPLPAAPGMRSVGKGFRAWLSRLLRQRR